MVRLYRYLYLMACLNFPNVKFLKCSRFVGQHMEWHQYLATSVAISTGLDKHSYLIMFRTTFHGVQRWQDEADKTKQSILLVNCKFDKCVELPKNFYCHGCETVEGEK